MMNEYEIAQRSLEDEVNREAARLIHEGIASGWDALNRARANILERRRSQKRGASKEET